MTTAFTAETTKPRKPNEDIRFSATHSVSVSFMVVNHDRGHGHGQGKGLGECEHTVHLSDSNLRNEDNRHLTQVSLHSSLGGEIEQFQSCSLLFNALVAQILFHFLQTIREWRHKM